MMNNNAKNGAIDGRWWSIVPSKFEIGFGVCSLMRVFVHNTCVQCVPYEHTMQGTRNYISACMVCICLKTRKFKDSRVSATWVSWCLQILNLPWPAYIEMIVLPLDRSPSSAPRVPRPIVAHISAWGSSTMC